MTLPGSYDPWIITSPSFPSGLPAMRSEAFVRATCSRERSTAEDLEDFIVSIPHSHEIHWEEELPAASGKRLARWLIPALSFLALMAAISGLLLAFAMWGG